VTPGNRDPLTSWHHGRAARRGLLAGAIDVGSDDALAEYQEQRDAASLERFEATDAIASFAWNLSDVRLLHETLAKAMSREVKQLLGASVARAGVSRQRPAAASVG
jgi:hypothetical protein